MIEVYLKETELNGTKTFKTYTKIENVKPDANNPRDISHDKMNDLKDFISKYGELKPVLVDIRPEKEGQLIGGNMRLKAYQELGKTEIWVEPIDPMSDAQAVETALIDNMNFGFYLEEKLKAQAQQYMDEIDLEKLTADLQIPANLSDLMKPQKNKDMKFEIIIRCENPEDLQSKMMKLAEVGLSGKQRGK